MTLELIIKADNADELNDILRSLGKTPQQVAAENGPSKTTNKKTPLKPETTETVTEVAPAPSTVAEPEPQPAPEASAGDDTITIEMLRKAIQEKAHASDENQQKVKAIFAECGVANATQLKPHQYRFAYDKIKAI